MAGTLDKIFRLGRVVVQHDDSTRQSVLGSLRGIIHQDSRQAQRRARYLVDKDNRQRLATRLLHQVELLARDVTQHATDLETCQLFAWLRTGKNRLLRE